MTFSPEAPRPFLQTEIQAKILQLRQLVTFAIPTSLVDAGEYELFRYKAYLVLEEPRSSFLALLVNVFLTICIVGSTVVFAVETIPSQEANQVLWWDLEIFFVSIFIAEYCIRFWARRTGWVQFVTQPMNVVDLLAVLPFFLEVTILYTGGYLDMRFLRSIRLVRLFKFGRHSTQLQLIIGGLKKSIWPLALVFLMLSLALVMFGTAMFMVERGTWDNVKQCYMRYDGSCSPFESIPESFWWGIATLTTVGYGDVYPITVGGKMVAALAMIVGIICVALPTTVLGVQFSEAYGDLKAKMEMDQVRTAATMGTPDGLHAMDPSKKGQKVGKAANRLVAALDTLQSIKRDLEMVLPQVRNDLLILANPDSELLLETKSPESEFTGPAQLASRDLARKADSLDAIVERSIAVLAANSVNSMQSYINFVLATSEEYFTMGSNQ